MSTGRLLAPALRWATAATLAASGYIHARLYADEYRFIHIVGPLFLLQASVSFAVAALLLIGMPPLMRIAAAGVALGALGGFAASRTVGVFGFTEHGLQPAPQALLSLLAETGTLLLLATWQATATEQHRAARPSVRTPIWERASLHTPPE
ncbi:hypothetical protein [Streptomyces kebangsaanensis]|uniref:hypothetical protein n=1 Tax=Streptomyces kebangsaanensis TaxID=864058 RepID=UPI00093C7D17|nr:hypothetical protein [Streptomyces kebangsaanensis]